MQQRERFGSRLGFILISAGCAIGLGNVWRFPYIVGQNGGAAFVLIYLFFLVVLGLPIMVMEFSVGRASQKSVASSFRALEPKGSKWHWFGYFAMAGNYLLMMFYTTIAGWMLAYLFKMARGEFSGLSAGQVQAAFQGLQADPTAQILWMLLVVLLGFGICSLGLRNGVEKITKVMMTCLLAILGVLAVHSILLPGAGEGLRFYLMPDFGKMTQSGTGNVVFAAMGQAFFTLSIGIGSMAIFGTYIDKERSLMGESLNIMILDTCVAFVAGLIIFPACSAFNVQPDSGPNLIFITLPNVFNGMEGGALWGSLFFVFMSFAALSTVVAVFENILSFAMDLWGWSRRKAALINILLVAVLSVPCALGPNLLGGFTPFGPGSSVLDLEDFIVSNNLLPLGALVYLFFCVSRYGWGWDQFIAEADAGRGLKFPRWTRKYVTYVLPIIVLYILIQGYLDKFLFH
ncbi:Na+-dependent transporters of the SNF family [uncultured Clostridium sp.]|nr:Na+-dependent transporters of the SNF family [uncultured Clostridium sp.]